MAGISSRHGSQPLARPGAAGRRIGSRAGRRDGRIREASSSSAEPRGAMARFWRVVGLLGAEGRIGWSAHGMNLVVGPFQPGTVLLFCPSWLSKTYSSGPIPWTSRSLT